MKRLVLCFLVLLALFGCERRGDVVRENNSFGFVKSADYGSIRGEYGSYWIAYSGAPTQVTQGIYSDGRNIVVGSGGGQFTMLDRDADEKWSLSLREGQQVLVRGDRSTYDVPGFASSDGSGIVFSNTEDEVLKRVVATYKKQQANKPDMATPRKRSY
jgi:hypothetical protein